MLLFYENTWLIIAKNKDKDIPNKYTRTIAGYTQIEHAFFALNDLIHNIDILVLSDIEDVRKICDSYNIKNSNFDYELVKINMT